MSTTALAIEDLETVYDQLAEAIAEAGEAREALFLTKLALLLANELGDRMLIEAAIQSARRDL